MNWKSVCQPWRDDMIETLFRYLIALYVLLLLCIIIGNSLILKCAFMPLRKLLSRIENRQFGEKNTIDLGKLIKGITADRLIIRNAGQKWYRSGI
jgi:hypothetical protein